MKKFIAAFDGLKYATSTRDYALYLSKLTSAHLVGLFLDDPTYSSHKIYDAITQEGIAENKIKEYAVEDAELRKKAADDFEEHCRNNKLEHSIHHDHHVASVDILHESNFADLLIINTKETFTHYTEKIPTRFIKDVLSSSKCPVLLTPSKFHTIEKIVLLYDGEPSSVYAIKMFSYILPQLKFIETELLCINAPTSDLHLPDNKLIKEWMKKHFADAQFTVIKGWAEEEILKQIKQTKENTLIVIGAYSRGLISNWLKNSMANVLMKEINFPMFIAHV